MRKKLSYFTLLAAVVLLALLISVFKWQLMLIHGESMEPSFRSGAIVVLEKDVKEYRRGDVVLYRCNSIGRSIVKRIAAVPGDTVCAENDSLLINGRLCAALPEAALRPEYLKDGVFTVPEGRFFLLGDNSERSIDSRYAEIGLADKAGLRGRVID